MISTKSAVVVQKLKVSAKPSQLAAKLTGDAIRQSARKARQLVMTQPKTHEVVTFIELE